MSPDIDFWSRFGIFRGIDLKFGVKEGIGTHINISKGQKNRSILRYKNDLFCTLNGCSSVNYERISEKLDSNKAPVFYRPTIF